MKHRLRGASHLALLATLALTLGFSTVALAAAAKQPDEVGTGIGISCANANQDCAECAERNCNKHYPAPTVDEPTSSAGPNRQSYEDCVTCAKFACTHNSGPTPQCVIVH